MLLNLSLYVGTRPNFHLYFNWMQAQDQDQPYKECEWNILCLRKTRRIKRDQQAKQKNKNPPKPTMLSVSVTRPLTFKICPPSPAFSLRTHMESPPRTHFTPTSHSPQTNPDIKDTSDGFTITLQEWQGWGAVSPLPAKVVEIVKDLQLLEKSTEVQMSFSGHRGKLEVIILLMSKKGGIWWKRFDFHVLCCVVL